MQNNDVSELELIRIMRVWYPKRALGLGDSFLQRIIFYKSFSNFERTCLEVSQLVFSINSGSLISIFECFPADIS